MQQRMLYVRYMSVWLIFSLCPYYQRGFFSSSSRNLPCPVALDLTVFGHGEMYLFGFKMQGLHAWKTLEENLGVLPVFLILVALSILFPLPASIESVPVPVFHTCLVISDCSDHLPGIMLLSLGLNSDKNKCL